MAIRNFRRLFSSVSQTFIPKNISSPHGYEKQKPLHIFSKMCNWKSKGEFTQHLKDHIVYNEGGVIAINKPYGVCLQNRANDSPSSGNQNRTQQVGAAPYSLEDCLPQLSTELGVSKLIPVYRTERYASGVALFAVDKETEQRIISSLRSSYPQKINPYSYLAISLARPQPPSASEKVGLSWFTHESFEGKLPIIVTEFSKKSMERNLVKAVSVDYATAAFSNITSSISEPLANVSLIDIKVSTATNHFLRVFLADRVSPVLGDHIYGNRVASILGTAMKLGPVHAASVASHQNIPQNILDRLGVKHSSQVPTFLHLREIRLPKFYKKKDLIIKADIPEHFMFTCKSLNLDLK